MDNSIFKELHDGFHGFMRAREKALDDVDRELDTFGGKVRPQLTFLKSVDDRLHACESYVLKTNLLLMRFIIDHYKDMGLSEDQIRDLQISEMHQDNDIGKIFDELDKAFEKIENPDS